MATVFLSHASEDLVLAFEVHKWLKREGHQVFLDEDIADGVRGGEDWQRRLLEELYRADAVLFVVTEYFVGSYWCTAEAAIANTLGKRTIPISVGAGNPQLVPTMERAQFIKWDEQPLARERITGILGELDLGAPGTIPNDTSPYPGLRPYDQKLSWAYCGREREVIDLADTLRSPGVEVEKQIVVVVGPSGCGKSSLVQAGLGPELCKDPDWWVLSIVAPGDDPLFSLATSIAQSGRSVGLGWTPSMLRGQLYNSSIDPGPVEAGEPTLIRDLIVDMRSSPRISNRRILLIIDQLEEVFTRASPEVRTRFTRVLAEALDCGVRVLATLQSEFLGAYQRSEDLGQLPMRSYLLAPLSDYMLRSVVETPAKRAGIRVSRDLVDTLVSETGHGNALPLLAFTLNQLGGGARRGDSLSMEDYIRLGGVSVALQRQANLALDARISAGREYKQIISNLLSLVTVDRDGLPARKRLAKDMLTVECRDDLDAFVARRLLTTEEIDGRAYISVAHERFISDWAPLAEVVAERSIALKTLVDLEQTANEWHDAGRPQSYLWSQGRLSLAFPDRQTDLKTLPLFGKITARDRGLPLTATTQAFVDASRRQARRHTLLTMGAALLFTVILTVTTAVAISRSRDAEEQRMLATSRGVVDRADSLRESNPLLALQLGIAADKLVSTDETRSSLLETLVETKLTGRALSDRKQVTNLTLSPDNRLLAINDGTGRVEIWSLTQGGELKERGFISLGSNSASAVFTSGSDYLVVGLSDGRLSVWDVQATDGPREVADPVAAHSGAITAMALSPDGRTLVTASTDRTVLLWSMEFPEKPSRVGPPLTKQLGPILSVAFSADKRMVATGSADGTFVLWNVKDLSQPRFLSSHQDGSPAPVRAVQFAADARTLAVAAEDGVTLWDVRDQNNVQALAVQPLQRSGQITTMAPSQAGGLLAIGGPDDIIQIWNTAGLPSTRVASRELRGHADPIRALTFSSDGHFLISGSQEGAVLVWDLRTPQMIRHVRPMRTESVPLVVEAHPTKDLIAVGDESGTVRLWDLRDPTALRPVGNPLRGHEGRVTALAFSANGRVLASGSYDQTIRLWDLSDPAAPRAIGGPLRGHEGRVTALAFSPNGRTLASGSYDRTIRLWDVGDPASPRAVGSPLRGHSNSITGLVFTGSSDTLASSGFDGSLILWDTQSSASGLIGLITTDGAAPILSMSQSPDKKTLVGATTSGKILLWDISNTHRPRQVSELRTESQGAVRATSVSPHSTDIVAVDTAAKFGVWESANINLPRKIGDSMPIGSGPVTDMTFDRTGKLLVTVNASGNLDVWTLSTLREYKDNLLDRACSRSVRGLSEVEWERYIPGVEYRRTCP